MNPNDQTPINPTLDQLARAGFVVIAEFRGQKINTINWTAKAGANAGQAQSMQQNELVLEMSDPLNGETVALSGVLRAPRGVNEPMKPLNIPKGTMLLIQARNVTNERGKISCDIVTFAEYTTGLPTAPAKK